MYKNMPATTAMNQDADSALRSRPIPIIRPINPQLLAKKFNQAALHLVVPLFMYSAKFP